MSSENYEQTWGAAEESTIDAATLADLKAKHGDIVHLKRAVDEEQFEAVFRYPTRVEYRKFKTEAGDEETKVTALETLVIACCVHPDGPAFSAMLDRRPGLIDSFGNGLARKAGLGEAKVVKK